MEEKVTYSIIALIYKISGINLTLISLIVHIFQLTSQTALFCFHNIDNDTFLIHYFFSNYIYKIPENTDFLSFNNFEISKISNI